MSIFNNKNSAVITSLSLMAIAASGLSFSTTGLADSHIVRVDANTGIKYNSALSNYRAMDDSEQSGWKQSNDTVGKIGGWRTYANEAYQANKRMDEEKMSEVEASETSVDESVEPEASAVTASAVPVPELTMTKNDDTELISENESMAPKIKTPKPIVGLSHQSATNLHRAYKEITLQDWKAANERVGEIGGWRTYANEAYQANKKMAEEAGANQ